MCVTPGSRIELFCHRCQSTLQLAWGEEGGCFISASEKKALGSHSGTSKDPGMIYFRLLGKIHTALSTFPVSTGIPPFNHWAAFLLFFGYLFHETTQRARRYQRAAPAAGDPPVTGPIPGGDIGSAGLLGAELSKVVGLRIEEVTAPNVTLDVLSNSVLEITLKLKLHIAVTSPLDLLGEIIEVEVLKNITIAIRRGDPSLVLEDCKTPLGYMDIKVLKASSLPLENEILTLVTRVLDRTLPQILQKILCPVIGAVVSSLDGTSLSTARLPPGGNSPSSVFKMSFNPNVIVLELTGRSLIEQTLPPLPENTTEPYGTPGRAALQRAAVRYAGPGRTATCSRPVRRAGPHRNVQPYGTPGRAAPHRAAVRYTGTGRTATCSRTARQAIYSRSGSALLGWALCAFEWATLSPANAITTQVFKSPKAAGSPVLMPWLLQAPRSIVRNDPVSRGAWCTAAYGLL
ncbi:BPI fold-containing family B member 4 [Platysternon megacephalum]|uniref:BPI fold-containing family B member 4 n=1 Tax=Platysternon megacephalum TaxID=55544 RepID=A0A4D9E213_9SAUR|nr:BPI fold-containing family B member 4 [Platysternon megacephalum]